MSWSVTTLNFIYSLKASQVAMHTFIRHQCSLKMRWWFVKQFEDSLTFSQDSWVDNNTQKLPSPLMKTQKDNKQSWDGELNVGCKEGLQLKRAEPGVYRGPNRMQSMSATKPFFEVSSLRRFLFFLYRALKRKKNSGGRSVATTKEMYFP